MTYQTNLLDIAIQYHEALPKRIRHYLNGRGIPDHIINSHLLGWNGWRITIPIYNRDGEIIFFRLARDPQRNSLSPKMLSSPGAAVELYGWEHLTTPTDSIVICEGEFDRLVLEAQGFAAVTSTAGAATFRPQWAQELKDVRDVYACFDRDQAGRNGALVVGVLLPHAKIVELPEEVGEAGDVTDYFVRLKHTREDFLKLLDKAKPLSSPSQDFSESQPVPVSTPLSVSPTTITRAESVKNTVPIAEVISEYVKLRPSGNQLVANCPFHDDKVPSFTVYPKTNSFYCFGCRAHGDVIAFVQKAENLTFPQALEVLTKYTANDNGSKHQNPRPRRQTT